MADLNYNLILSIAKERGISYAQAKKELEFAVKLGEEDYSSHPREYWKNMNDEKNKK